MGGDSGKVQKRLGKIYSTADAMSNGIVPMTKWFDVEQSSPGNRVQSSSSGDNGLLTDACFRLRSNMCVSGIF